MKVFNFTNGVKGELLAEINGIQYTGGWVVDKNGSSFKVELTGSHGGPDDKWAWVTNAGHTVNGTDVDISPEDYGVGAVCFCVGEFFVYGRASDPDVVAQWWWRVVGTADWNRSACKEGILKATKL